MSVIHGVRVRGYGTRNLTWTVGRALVGKEFDKAAKAAGVTPLKAFFDADYAACRPLEPLEDEIDELEDDEAISSREADRRRKALEARANEEGVWFPIADGQRTAAALRAKLADDRQAANDLDELARLLKHAAKKGTEFRLYSNP